MFGTSGIPVLRPSDDKIYNIASQNIPHLRFEWHPKVRKVYMIDVRAAQQIGEPIAHEIENHGAAWNAVLIWCRGYHEGAGTYALQRSA